MVNLDDYHLGGNEYDLQAAVDTGEAVNLLENTYTVSGVKLDTRSVIRGIPSKSYLQFEETGPAIQPRDSTISTALVVLEHFQMCPTTKEGTGQHGIYMPSCWHWRLDRLDIQDFGGKGIYSYGQRTSSGERDPSDSTKMEASHLRVMRCNNGIMLSGTTATERIDGGTSNMNYLAHCMVSECAKYNCYIQQGTANTLVNFISLLAGYDGLTIGWYGNRIHGLTAEMNNRYGCYFTSHDETHDNRIFGWHDGGSNQSGMFNTIGSNGNEAY